MAIPISNVNSVSDTFFDWLDKTNQVLDNLSTKVITTEANTTGGITVGNAYVNGVFSANTITATQALRGGTVSTPGVLTIISNTAFTNASSNLISLVSNTSTSVLTSNVSTVIFNISSGSFVGGSLTVGSNTLFSNTTLFNNTVTVNSTLSVLGNTAIGTNAIYVDTTNKRVVVYGNNTSNTLNRLEVNGNTLISANLYVTGLLEAETISANTFNITGNLAFTGTSNGNFIPTTNSFSLGNSSNRWALLATSGNFTNSVTIAGNLTVNSAFSVGANLSVNSTSIFIGNSTVNTTITAGNAEFLGLGSIVIGNSSVNTIITGNSISTGNTTIAGFANITSTLASGNTTITGFANITSTLASGNTTITGFANISSTLAAGNTTITGQANVSSTLGVGLDIVLQGEVGSNTTQVRVGNSTSNSLILFNQFRVGNTTVNTTINPQTINVGANVSVNVAAIKVGNSTVNTVITGELISGNGSSITSINANNITSGVLPISRGGTGGASSVDALTNLLPSGATAGYVLATGGPGTYYWAAGGIGGGGGGSGTTINSSRLTYTANGVTTTYTTPTYVPGASQLRIYIDGVRQFASAYTEANSTSVEFLSAPPNNSVILVEVDGYLDFSVSAATVSFEAPFGGISSGANTVQLAIQDVETRKATLASPAFTGNAAFSNVAVGGTSFTGPTPSTGSNNTSVATTAFVRAVLNSANTFTMNISGTAANATFATNAANATFATSAGTATNATNAANATFATNAANATFATNAANATFATTAGSVTTAVNANNATFVNTHSVGQSLLTTSNVRFGSLGIGTAASGTTGEIRATNSIVAHYSDDRLKINLGNIPNSLDKVNTLSGFYFEENEVARSLGYNEETRQVGVSAQQVQVVLPEAVKPAPIDDKYLTVQYEKLVPLLIEAIKELDQKVKTLEEKISNGN